MAIDEATLARYRQRWTGAHGAIDVITCAGTALQVTCTEFIVRFAFASSEWLTIELAVIVELLSIAAVAGAVAIWFRWRPARWIQFALWNAWLLALCWPIAFPRYASVDSHDYLLGMMLAYVFPFAFVVAADSVRGRLAFRMPVSDQALALDHRIAFPP